MHDTAIYNVYYLSLKQFFSVIILLFSYNSRLVIMVYGSAYRLVLTVIAMVLVIITIQFVNSKLNL